MSKTVVTKKLNSIAPDIYAPRKEWDEALCAICMEHPHNAVILICSSHAKGCRPYICDTSYRHSNCLDRYRKMKPNNKSPTSGALAKKTNLTCPLCRGDVQGWNVIEDARNFLNTKTRSCSWDSCSYVGNYQELRRHARSVHPSARPAEIDPSKQREWRRLEIQRDYNDVVSSLRAAMPGAVVVGDYVIEDENVDDEIAAEREVLWTSHLFQLLAESRILPREPDEASSGGWWRRRQLWWESPLPVLSQSGGGDGGGGTGGGHEPNASSSSSSRRRRPSGDDAEDGLPLWRRRRLR